MAVRVFEMNRERIDNDAYNNMISMPFVASQSFNAASDGTGRSAAFNTATRVIAVQADENVAVRVGSGTPTAEATDFKITAGETIPIWVTPGHVLAARTL